jgi:uncharacterized glyoxalase superfamily protein PhnB
MSIINRKQLSTGTAPYLRVPDILKSVRYYQDVLGFTVDMLDLGFAILSRDRVSIMLQQWTAEDRYANGRWAGYVWVDDVDELHADCAAKEANVTPTVSTTQYGTREFQVEDPDGYFLRFGQIAAIG